MKFFRERIKIYQFFKPDIVQNTRFIIGIIITNIVLFAVGLLPAVLYKILIDDIMRLGHIKLLKWILLAYILHYFISAGMTGCSLRYIKILENKLRITYRIKILKKYLGKDMKEIKGLNVGDLKIRVDDDVNVVSKFFLEQMIDYIMLALESIVYLVLLLLIDWKMSLIAILMIPITFFVSYCIGVGQKIINESLWKNTSACNGWIQDTLLYWKEVKALGIEKMQEDTFTDYMDKECKLKITWMRYFIVNVILRRFKNTFVLNIFLYLIGGIFIINNMLTIGGLILIMKYYNNFFVSIDQLNNSNVSFKADMPALTRVIEILNEKRETKKIRKVLNGDICFENVSYEYMDSKNKVLKNLNLTIDQGEKIAIVGESGIGKTTIVKLMLGRLKPQQGQILIDGHNIDDVDLNYIYKSIGVVMQENVFLNLSIRENLLFAKSIATDKEIIEACQKAYIADFIETLPDKYNTIIGENGVKLSGGQKQRLALARVFLSNQDILVLDEATSSIDKKTEDYIYKVIEKLYSGRTVIIITHNPSVLKYANVVKKIEGVSLC